MSSDLAMDRVGDPSSLRMTARIAGFLYLVVILGGIFAQFFVRSRLIVPGDATTTVNNIMASERMFRIAFVADLVAATCYFLVGVALYAVLKPVNKTIALLFVLMVSISTAIQCTNLLNHFAALLLVSGADYLKVLGTAPLDALALFFLTMHKYGYLIAQIFFGGWLFPLGFLVYKSGYFPKVMGVLLIIASLGYLIGSFVAFLLPGHEVIAYPGYVLAAVGEISFCVWLLIKGVKIQTRDTGAPGST